MELLVSNYGSFLGKKSERLILKENGKVVNEIPFRDLEQVTIDTPGASLSTDLIRECVEHGVQISFLTPSGKPFAKLVSPYLTGTVITRREQLLAFTDARALGVNVPVKESGKLENTPGVQLVGPFGAADIAGGAIAALRHVHISPEQAKEAGVADKQIVSLKVPGERGLIFDNVLVRSGQGHEKEVHLDTDEANAAGLNNGMEVEILV